MKTLSYFLALLIALGIVLGVSRYSEYAECFWLTYVSTQSLEHSSQEIDSYCTRTRRNFPFGG